MVQLKYIVLSIGLTFYFSSCVTKTDDTAPDIESVFDGEVIADSLTVIAGEVLNLTFQLSDNSGLNTARFFISKKSEVAQSLCVIADTFEYLSITEISGNNYDYSPGITFPDSIIGIYNLEIGVYDDEGNFSNEDFVLSIENPNYPIIDSLNSENISTECIVSISDGDLSFELNVQASCSALIEEMKTYLSVNETLIESQTYTIGSSLINNDVVFTLPETGEYELVIQIVSSQGVSSWAVLEVSASN